MLAPVAMPIGISSNDVIEVQADGKAKEKPFELLFINQYGNGKYRIKEGPDRRVLGSYVQRHIHRKKRLNAGIRLNPKRWVAVSSTDDRDCQTSTDIPEQDSQLPFSTISVARGGQSHQGRSASKKPELPSGDSKVQPLGVNLIWQHNELPRDRHGLRFDPFSAYPIKFRESIPEAIDYCEQFLLLCPLSC